jgi:hypothetical protein
VGCTFADRCALADEVCHASEPPLAPVADSPGGRAVHCHLDAADLPVLPPLPAAGTGVMAEKENV